MTRAYFPSSNDVDGQTQGGRISLEGLRLDRPASIYGVADDV